MTEQMPHADRYRRGREFVDVVNGLWDSFADDAFVQDQESGIFFDPDKMHVLNHDREFFSVRGPLNIARSPQGRPVVVQAGASDPGRQLAAETADMIFTVAQTLDDGRAFRDDIHARMSAYGRDPSQMRILPAALVVVSNTVDEAHERRARLDSHVNTESAMAALSIALGHDASTFDPDQPLPDIPESNQSKSGRERAISLARRDNLTVRQLAQRLGGYGGLSILGTPETIADEMEDWLTSGACDGFTVMFPYLPAGLNDFVGKVVPELQRRGLLRRRYEGSSLRDHLGLPYPGNQFFD
jgi:alkanesulfonate monooxygenase